MSTARSEGRTVDKGSTSADFRRQGSGNSVRAPYKRQRTWPTRLGPLSLFESHCVFSGFVVSFSTMTVTDAPHMRKRLFIWWVMPVCLFLVSMGVRVPNLTTLHPPKPSARAIIEASNKTSQDATAKDVVALEFCDHPATQPSPEIFASRFHREEYRFSSITPALRSARAPPRYFS